MFGWIRRALRERRIISSPPLRARAGLRLETLEERAVLNGTEWIPEPPLDPLLECPPEPVVNSPLVDVGPTGWSSTDPAAPLDPPLVIDPSPPLTPPSPVAETPINAALPATPTATPVLVAGNILDVGTGQTLLEGTPGNAFVLVDAAVSAQGESLLFAVRADGSVSVFVDTGEGIVERDSFQGSGGNPSRLVVSADGELLRLEIDRDGEEPMRLMYNGRLDMDGGAGVLGDGRAPMERNALQKPGEPGQERQVRPSGTRDGEPEGVLPIPGFDGEGRQEPKGENRQERPRGDEGVTPRPPAEIQPEGPPARQLRQSPRTPLPEDQSMTEVGRREAGEEPDQPLVVVSNLKPQPEPFSTSNRPSLTRLLLAAPLVSAFFAGALRPSRTRFPCKLHKRNEAT